MTATPPTTPTPPTRESRSDASGDGADVDFGELFRRIVAVAGLRKPQVHRGLLVALGVLGALCVLATITRASAIPLIPLAGLAIAGYGAWRARTVTTDRQLVGCVALYAIAVSVSLWSMSYLARTLL